MQIQKNLEEIRINPIVQLSKYYYRNSKHEPGQSMCAAMNVFFHWRKMLIKRAHWAVYWRKYACTNLANVWTVNLLVHGTCLD